MVFDKNWFNYHQKRLLWLLNTPIIKIWFRWVLRIRQADCPLQTKITHIGPNRFSWGDRYFRKHGKWYLERTTDFRTKPKFANRLYYAFSPLWWMMHFWDWLVADRFVPELSFGFSTLGPIYPAAGANSPVDGYTYRGFTAESFSTIRAGAGAGASVTDLTFGPALEGGASANTFDYLERDILCFDTSPLTSSATISAVTFSFYGQSTLQGIGQPDLHVAGATPASTSTLAASDYSQIQRTSFGSVAFGSFNTAGYNDVSLNASGLAGISKTGVTSFSLQTSWDINNNFTGTWAQAQSNLVGKSADQAGTTTDPKLVVTYTIAGGTQAHLLGLLGVGN